eukprot:CCRYP_013560-RA/>CCRYP_013560-RA protein AED:0.16 eAED:0.16 QI:3186/0.5/0.66/1/0/0/3/0/101
MGQDIPRTTSEGQSLLHLKRGNASPTPATVFLDGKLWRRTHVPHLREKFVSLDLVANKPHLMIVLTNKVGGHSIEKKFVLWKALLGISMVKLTQHSIPSVP